MSSKLIFQMYKGHSVLNPTSYICHQNRKLVTLLTSDTRELWPAAKQNFWWAISKQQSQLGIQRQMRRVTGGKYLVQKRSFKAPTRPWKAAPLRQKAHLRFCKVLSAFDASAECEAKLFSKLVWICFESSPQLCQEVKKRSDLNHLHSLRLPFRVAPYQVAVLNELLNCRWLDLKRRVFCFFFQPWWMAVWSLGGPHRCPGSRQRARCVGQSEKSHVGGHTWVILNPRVNCSELIAQRLSSFWLHKLWGNMVKVSAIAPKFKVEKSNFSPRLRTGVFWFVFFPPCPCCSPPQTSTVADVVCKNATSFGERNQPAAWFYVASTSWVVIFKRM